MTRVTFDQELQRLQDRIIVMGSMVAEAIEEAIDILLRQDVRAAKRLVKRDRRLDEMRYDIEGDVLVLMARHQPMATDLRTLAAMLEIVTDLERIGDYAEGIGKITRLLGNEEKIPPIPQIPQMGAKAADMLQRAVDAFIRQDVEAALAIPQEDDEVDDLYNEVNANLLEMILKDPTKMEQANYLVWAAHNLERSADRVTNICERVLFTVTGDMRELD